MKSFQKLSDWLNIEYVDDIDLHLPESARYVFIFEGSIRKLNDFTKIHCNPWFGNDDGYPEFITAVERYPVGEPLYIEINDQKTQVRVYKEETNGSSQVR